MITIGILAANLIAACILRSRSMDLNDLLILEGCTFLGAFTGAKMLFLLLSFRQIDIRRIADPVYLNQLMLSGFVFYGGLAGGLCAVMLAGRSFQISWRKYLHALLFLVPFIHGFGRIGCFLAGCCYGISYEGLLSVTFPPGSFAPSGVPLFPVQLLEAFLLFSLSGFLCFLSRKKEAADPLPVYLSIYAILRFFLEFLRGDAERGIFFGMSASQWLSLALLTAVLPYGLRSLFHAHSYTNTR